ncbi:MAG: putative ion transport protein [Frankiales bacterium]|nr:putative ion transport protein [Frankiales bacterium]
MGVTFTSKVADAVVGKVGRAPAKAATAATSAATTVAKAAWGPHRPLRNPFLSPPGVDLVHPGRPVHAGSSLAKAVVDCALYSGGKRLGGRVDLATAIEQASAHPDGFVWIGLLEPDQACLEQVAAQFALHPLAVEDAVMAHQRPKLDTYGDSLFVVLKTVRYVDRTEVIETGELMIFAGERFVVTVRHGVASELQTVRADLEGRPDLLRMGPVAVLYGVIDRVVDGYLPAADAVEQDVDEIQEQVFSTHRTQPTERIYKLKRELVEFRRALEPLRGATQTLAKGDLPLVDRDAATWFRDIDDHVQRAADHVRELDTLLDNALTANLAQVSMRQNDDMRKISAWVAICPFCTLIAGIYGMNFDNMPELRWHFGYPGALGLMAVLSLGLYRTFKRNHWL